MIWYGMVWYGMVWYGMVYGMCAIDTIDTLVLGCLQRVWMEDCMYA